MQRGEKPRFKKQDVPVDPQTSDRSTGTKLYLLTCAIMPPTKLRVSIHVKTGSIGLDSAKPLSWHVILGKPLDVTTMTPSVKWDKQSCGEDRIK